MSSLAIWLWIQSSTLRTPWLSRVRTLVRLPSAFRWNMVWCLPSDRSNPLETSARLNSDSATQPFLGGLNRGYQAAKLPLELTSIPAQSGVFFDGIGVPSDREHIGERFQGFAFVVSVAFNFERRIAYKAVRPAFPGCEIDWFPKAKPARARVDLLHCLGDVLRVSDGIPLTRYPLALCARVLDAGWPADMNWHPGSQYSGPGS